MDSLLLISLTLVFLGVLISPLVYRFTKKYSPWLLSLISLFPFLLYIFKTPEVISGKMVLESYSWVEALGFSLRFHLDGLGLLFALLISGIGTLIVIYGGTYLAKDKNIPKFYSYLFLFMGSMLGLVLSDNIFSLFIFWELTSLSSYLLIGYKHGYEDSRRSALQALLVTGTGGLALMAGLILLSASAGSPNFSEWFIDGETHSGNPHYAIMLILLFLGAFTKSAQFPFHFWLPNAMVAPTPVSAYLHSATMVKAGVYLLARLNPYFAYSGEWQVVLTTVGGFTMLFGAVWAIFQSDLKKILAYTTISALGLMVFFIGIGTPKAIQGAMVFLMAHALYKGGLFMIAGNIDHATGTRDINKLSGLFSKLKFTGTAAVLTTLSMAGFPSLFGFMAKELLYESALHAPFMAIALTLAVFFTGVIFAYLSILIGWKIFFSDTNITQEGIHEVKTGMYFGPLILGVTGLIAGLLPGLSVEGFLAKTAFSVSREAFGLNLYLWHGFNLVLALSALTLLGGLGLYKVSWLFKRAGRWITIAEKFGPEVFYDKSWKLILRIAEIITRFFQSGYLRFYIMTILITLIGLILFSIWHYKIFELNISVEGVKIYEVILALLVVISIVFTVRATSRLAAIAIMGVTGYGIAIFFAIYGGIDLAMTQFLIETLTVVVFVLVLFKLPPYMKISSTILRFRDSVLAITGGITMTIVILLVTNYPLVSELKFYFSENSYILAKGRNVVNVILVDFRALDTLGEITVLAIAALGVFAMMKLRLSKREE